MKTLHKVLIMAVSLIGLSGCMASASTVKTSHPASVNHADEIRVEAQGLAYMGDTDTLSEVKQRAWDNAIDNAVNKGATVIVERQRENNFGVMTRDDSREIISGYLEDIDIVSEGLQGMTYRIDITALYVPRHRSEVSAAPMRKAVTHYPASSKINATSTETVTTVVSSDRDIEMTVCCRDFPARLSNQVGDVLERVGRIKDEWRDRTGQCYAVDYAGSKEELFRQIDRGMEQYNRHKQYQRHYSSNSRHLDLVFDGGYE